MVSLQVYKDTFVVAGEGWVLLLTPNQHYLSNLSIFMLKNCGCSLDYKVLLDDVQCNL